MVWNASRAMRTRPALRACCSPISRPAPIPSSNALVTASPLALIRLIAPTTTRCPARARGAGRQRLHLSHLAARRDRHRATRFRPTSRPTWRGSAPSPRCRSQWVSESVRPTRRAPRRTSPTVWSWEAHWWRRSPPVTFGSPNGWCETLRRRAQRPAVNTNRVIVLYSQALMYLGPVLVLAVLIADPRWLDQIPELIVMIAAAIALRGLQIPLSKYSYLTQTGLVALAGSLVVGLPATARGGVRRGLLVTDLVWLRKSAQAAAVNAGREVIATVAAFGVYAAVVRASGAPPGLSLEIVAGPVLPGARVLRVHPAAVLLRPHRARQARAGRSVCSSCDTSASASARPSSRPRWSWAPWSTGRRSPGCSWRRPWGRLGCSSRRRSRKRSQPRS